MPPGLQKRWPGYGIDRFLRLSPDLNNILAGSEGTLAAICSAELKIVPLPRAKGLGIIFFASVTDAMQATVELLDLKPASIEHIDRVLFDQTKGQLLFQAARDLLELDAKPCEALLLVEFYDNDVADRLAALSARRLGLRTTICRSNTESNLVLGLRKAGLTLLTGMKGDANPPGAVAGLRGGTGRDHETARAERLLLRPRRHRFAPRKPGARSPWRERPEDFSRSERRSGSTR